MSLDFETILTATVIGYLLGSIPFGLLLTRMAGMGDIRNIGSGNIGATNVLRTGNKGLAAATLFLDALKGAAAVFIVWFNWKTEAGMIAGLAAFAGHLFPFWLQFKGGKGVATYIGVLVGIDWLLAIVFCTIWLSVALVSRYSSLSALIASLIVPVLLAVQTQWFVCIIVSLMTLLIYIKHKANIERLIKGEEPQIGASKPQS